MSWASPARPRSAQNGNLPGSVRTSTLLPLFAVFAGPDIGLLALMPVIFSPSQSAENTLPSGSRVCQTVVLGALQRFVQIRVWAASTSMTSFR